jgi:3-hydroxy-3-methylglutaryl CoA synthase
MTRLPTLQRCGVHIPRLRLARASIAAAMSWANPPARGAPAGARATLNWDEDALTMAVEAARQCTAPGLPEALDTVFFCSTSAPFADRDNAVMLSAALDLPEECRALNLGGSMRAATGGLLSALGRAESRPVLVAASDARLTRPGSAQELSYGDAAAAFLVGPARADALATVLASQSMANDFVDHYRMSDAEFDYALEERWVRDESLMARLPAIVSRLLAQAGVSASDVRHLALPAPASAARRVAEACALKHARRDERVLLECGDAGAALPFLLLIAALETAQAGDLIVALGVGQGVDALLLRAERGAGTELRVLARALSQSREEASYVRYLSSRGLVEVDFGMRAERDQRTAHTVAYRKRDAITGFKGGRCERCGTVQFPRSRVCVNPLCRATDTQQPHRLADSSGRVKTFTEDWQAFSVRPPYIYGNVEFAEGGNLLMEFSDLDAEELHVNDAVRFVYRIKDEDRARGFRRYFWKAVKA